MLRGLSRCSWSTAPSRKCLKYRGLNTSSGSESSHGLSPKTKHNSKIEGLFLEGDLTSASSFARRNAVVEQKCVSLLKEVESENRSRNMVVILDDMSNEICNSADMMECLRHLHPDEGFATAAEKSMAQFGRLVETLNTTPILYNTLKCAHDKGDVHPGGVVDRRVEESLIADFQASGVQLPQKEREEFVALSEEIFVSGAQFNSSACSPILIEEDILQSPATSQNIRQVIQKGTYLTSPLGDSPQSSLRLWGFKNFYRHCPVQEKNLRRLLSARHKMAALTGYK